MSLIGGDSYSTSDIYNSLRLTTKVNNIIDTSSLAEVNKSSAFALNKTLKGFSDFTTAINKNIADTLQVLAQNSNTDNKQQDVIIKTTIVIISGLFTYFAIKNNMENK